jgi:UDP-glucose 4-epimerase
MKIASQKPVCDIINVGTGKSYSLNELVQKINKALDKNIEPIYKSPEIRNYIRDTRADTEKMKKIIGGSKVDFSEGITRVISSA